MKARICQIPTSKGRPRPIKLRTLDDAEVAFCAGAEGLKRALVGVALVSRQSKVIAVEFDHNGARWQPGFMSLNLAGRSGQKASTEGFDYRHSQSAIGLEG